MIEIEKREIRKMIGKQKQNKSNSEIGQSASRGPRVIQPGFSMETVIRLL